MTEEGKNMIQPSSVPSVFKVFGRAEFFDGQHCSDGRGGYQANVKVTMPSVSRELHFRLAFN